MNGYRAQQAALKQRQILEAARRLFTELGFEGTTMDALAAAAGVSKQTLYRYFPGKEQLLVAVMRAMTVDTVFGDDLLSLPPDATRQVLQTQLTALACGILQRAMDPDYLNLARLIIGESGRRPELAQLFRQAVAGAGSTGLRDLFAQAQARRLLRADVDLRLAVPLFAGPLLTWVIGTGLLSGARVPQPPPREVMAELVRLILDGVATQ